MIDRNHKNHERVKIQMEACCPWITTEEPNTRYIRVRLKAPPRVEELPPMEIAFLISISDSMRGEHLDLAKKAVIQGLKRLRPQDSFSITTFCDTPRRLVKSALATPENIAFAIRWLNQVPVDFGTDPRLGWRNARNSFQTDSKSKFIWVFSNDDLDRWIEQRSSNFLDGSSAIELYNLAKSGTYKGIRTYTFAFGAKQNHHKLSRMAEGGSGIFTLVKNSKMIPKMMRNIFDDIIELSLRDVRMQLLAPRGICTLRILEKPNAQNKYYSGWRERKVYIEFGNLRRHQVIDLYFEVQIDPVAEGPPLVFNTQVFDADHRKSRNANLSFERTSEPAPQPCNPDILATATLKKNDMPNSTKKEKMFIRFGVLMCLFLLGCGAQKPVAQTSDVSTASQKQCPETKDGLVDIFVNENSTTINNNVILRADSFSIETSNLLPHTQKLKDQNIQKVVIYAGPDTQAGHIHQVMYALGSAGYQEASIQTCAGKAKIYMPTLGFQPVVQIILEQHGTRVRIQGTDVPSQPPCPDPSPTFCNHDRTKDLQDIVKLINNLPTDSDSTLDITVTSPETMASQDLLDILQLFAGDPPAIQARISLAVTQ